MNIFTWLIYATCSFGAFDLSADPYELSICAIFQDDAKYIPEWIEFHEKQGVEHFYLYNNLSTDDWQTYLNPYILSGLVEVIDWPLSSHDSISWNFVQCSAYNDVLRRAKSKWVACLDTDEFLYAPGMSIVQALADFNEYGGVAVNWMMYGTSGIQSCPNDKLLDYLVWRAKDDYGANRHIKSIVNPKDVIRYINPHWAVYKCFKYAVDENFNHVPYHETTSVSTKKLRINHYWSRDIDFFYNVKLMRRRKWYNDDALQIQMETQMNDVFDDSIIKQL